MDIRLFSETEPTDVYTGRIWIKPSTASAYMRLGSTWVTIGSAGDPATYTRISVWIDGIDKTNMILKESLSITDILTKEVDTCSFILCDSEGTNKPQVGQEVLIWYKSIEGATPVLRFAGTIEEIPQEQFAVGKYNYEVTCVDFTSDLNKKLVVETYTSQTAGDIIRDIVSVYAPTLGAYYVQDGPTIDYLAFNYKYPLEALEELAELTGYDWYVDYNRNIHFFESTTNVAPYSLTESSGSGDYLGLSISVIKTDLQNAITVRGGYEFSSLYTQEEVADGTQESFPFRYEPFTPISVYVDTGGGYVAKTLGIDNIDESGRDFVYNATEKVIKNLDYAILSAGHKIKLTYTYKKPVLAYVEDEESIRLMKQYEGGDGIYEGPLIVDDKIETKAQARIRGQAELDQYSNPLVEGSFTTTQYGYRSGQLLTIDIPSRRINAQYLIQEVTATSLGKGRFEYEVSFATLLKGLTQYLIQLHKDSRIEFDRTDEILDRLKITPDEEFTLSDSVPVESRRDITASPYVWSNDAGTTVGKGRFGLAEWG